MTARGDFPDEILSVKDKNYVYDELQHGVSLYVELLTGQFAASGVGQISVDDDIELKKELMKTLDKPAVYTRKTKGKWTFYLWVLEELHRHVLDAGMIWSPPLDEALVDSIKKRVLKYRTDFTVGEITSSASLPSTMVTTQNDLTEEQLALIEMELESATKKWLENQQRLIRLTVESLNPPPSPIPNPSQPRIPVTPPVTPGIPGPNTPPIDPNAPQLPPDPNAPTPGVNPFDPNVIRSIFTNISATLPPPPDFIAIMDKVILEVLSGVKQLMPTGIQPMYGMGSNAVLMRPRTVTRSFYL